MIDPSLRHEIKGLDELFKYIPEDYSFHDSELESVNWDLMKGELTVVYSCAHWLSTPVGEHVYYVTFHIKPEMNDFEVYISPHNPYTDGIQITRLENMEFAKYHFRAECSGPIVNCEDLWVEIREVDPKAFFDN